MSGWRSVRPTSIKCSYHVCESRHITMNTLNAMTTLKIPYALDEQHRIVHIADALSGHRYVCPECRSPLRLRAGLKKARHFSHQPNGVCSSESVLHKIAKLLIQQTVLDWKNGIGQRPMLERRCLQCNNYALQPLPDKVTTITLEQRVPAEFVIDVALWAGTAVAAAVEVRVTHAVDDHKAQTLDVPFFEVEGQAILERPHVWRPVRDTLKPFACERCTTAPKRFIDLTEKIAAMTKIPLPRHYYRYAPYQCRNCHQQILVFTWPTYRAWPARRPEGAGKPRTILFRAEKFETGYWMNTCPYCKESIGYTAVHYAPNGPFYYVSNSTKADAFQRDLEIIAYTIFSPRRITDV
jgi:hypothetical protein